MKMNKEIIQQKKIHNYDTFHLILAIVVLGVFIWSMIGPASWLDWLAENILVFLSVAAIIIFAQQIRLNKFAYLCFAVYLIFHIYALHYAYLAPGGYWIGALLGTTRNMFDRVVHFLFGFLLIVPFTQIFENVFGQSRRMAILSSIMLVGATSAIYEILEWVGFLVLQADVAKLFVSTQGDIWDSQKDMLCAIVGSLIGGFLYARTWPWQKKQK